MRRLLFALALAATPLHAAPADPITGWIDRNKPALLREYTELVAVPSVAADPAGLRRTAELIRRMMDRRGLSPRLLETADRKSPPMVYGEWRVPGAKRTLIFYAHYDGQPVDLADWKVTPPFTPKLLSDRADRSPSTPPADAPIGDDWRVYARGASDDKAGVMAILAAVDALKAAGKRPAFNLKIVFEGEEEAGSPNLPAMLRQHKALLASDGWVIVDGPAHQSGPPQLSLGVRGDVNASLTVYGPARPLHSGHYGNWAPNPGMMLAQLLASMKNPDGTVAVRGWNDDVTPLNPAERAALAAAPSPDVQLKRDLALPWTEGGGAKLIDTLMLPSLNVNGMRAAEIGDKSANVIPTSATAALDLRLVLGNTPARQVAKLADHIRAQGYAVLDRAPTLDERRAGKIATLIAEPGYPAERTAVDHPLAAGVARALRAAGPVVVLPSLGGSLPLYMIRQETGASNVVLSLWNPDNNQHAADENLRLGNLWTGIARIATVMIDG